MFRLVACLLFVAEPAAAAPETQPVVEAPAVTVPAASVPAATVPAASVPAVTIPEATVPAATVSPPAAPEAAPAAAPPAAAEAAPIDPSAPLRVTVSLGLGRAWPGGLVYEGIPMNDLTSALVGIQLDFGFRITQRWMVALAIDAGGGTPGLADRLTCGLNGVDCSIASVRTSLEGRYVFTPTAKRTWWVGAGLGSETTRVVLEGSQETRAFLPSYIGGVFPRLSAGWDRRMGRYWGWGFYGALSSGRYTKKAMGDSDATDMPADVRGHSWLDLGVRFILFP